MAVTRRANGDAGAGLIGAIAGVSVFLGFLLFAVQLLYNLYSASVITGIAYDTARRVAASAEPPAAALTASDAARHQLGPRCGDDCLTWSFDHDERDLSVVRLRVRVDSPTVLPPSLAGPLGFDTVDRTVTVRTEAFR